MARLGRASRRLCINAKYYRPHGRLGNNDITGDLHGMYKAGPGWDACSGLGVPNGAALQNLLVA